MALINISNLTFSYENSYEDIFTNVTIQIDTDWKLGFIGRNGRGKTTFLHLLQGQFEYSGNIYSTVEFDYFPFDVESKDKNTIDIIKDINKEIELWKINVEFSMLSIDEDVLERPFKTLSNGEQTKVLLAVLFLKDNNFLLLDEPTNHLDSNSRMIICEYLKKKKGFIVISHDRLLLDNCVDHILAINKANIEIQRGNFSSWQENKLRQDEYEEAENEKLQKDINRMSESYRRSSEWSDEVEKTKYGTRFGGLRPDRGYIGHKSAKMMKRAKTYENRQLRAIEEKQKLLKNVDKTYDLEIKQIPYHKTIYASFYNISLYYDNKTVCTNVNFEINMGDRIAICGKNGSGKSTILKLLVGEGITYSGFFNKESRLIISYIPQDISYLKGSFKKFISDNNIKESLFRSILHKLDFTAIQLEKDMNNYSDGQKKKILIAMSLSQEANLYVWDEPLNFIDVISRLQIENLILKHKPTMIFVEHDNIFVDKIASKIIEL